MKSVWTFQGAIGLQTFKWSTAPMEGFEPLLAEPPSSFKYGLSDTVGNIERMTTSITLFNDGSLDSLALGTGDDLVDYEGPSLRDIRGQILRYTSEGEWVLMTPSLLVTDIRVDVGTITLNLAAREDGILGASDRLVTVDQLRGEFREGRIFQNWAHWQIHQRLDIGPGEEVTAFFQALDPGNDTVIPYLYGPQIVELQSVSSDGNWSIAGIVGYDEIPRLQSARYGTFYSTSGAPCTSADKPLPMVLSSDLYEGALLAFWHPRGNETRILLELQGEATHPARVMAQILDDHSQPLNPPFSYDPTSLQRAIDATPRMDGVVAGQFGDAASIEEILSLIAPIAGIETYLGRDNRLHFVTIPETLEPTFHLDPYDTFPSGDDRIPGATADLASSPPLFGSTVGKVSINWPQWARTRYPVETSNNQRILSRHEGEFILEGDWIRPSKASIVLSAASEWFAYPVRVVTIPTHVDIMEQVEPGTIITFQVPSLPGNQRRVGMVRSIEVVPSDETAFVTIADLGWEGMVVNGVLDSFYNWIAIQPSAGASIFLEETSGLVQISGAGFKPHDVGRTLWVFGSRFSQNNRSYKIVSVEGSTQIIVSPKPWYFDSWTEDGSGTALVMKNAGTDDFASVEGKIAGSSEPFFENGERAYRFSR